MRLSFLLALLLSLSSPALAQEVAAPAGPSTQPCAAATADQPLSYIEMVKQKKAAAARQAIEAHAGRRATESVAGASNEEPLSYIELVKRKKCAAKMKQAADATAPPSTDKEENQGKEENEDKEDKEGKAQKRPDHWQDEAEEVFRRVAALEG